MTRLLTHRFKKLMRKKIARQEKNSAEYSDINFLGKCMLETGLFTQSNLYAYKAGRSTEEKIEYGVVVSRARFRMVFEKALQFASQFVLNLNIHQFYEFNLKITQKKEKEITHVS